VFIGVRDDVHQDFVIPVTVRTVSSDPKYNGLTQVVTVTNLDVYWPDLDYVLPEVIPMVGLNASIRGGISIYQRKFFNVVS